MMSFKVRVENFFHEIWMEKRGLNPMGRVQKYIDSEVMRKMDPYTPHLSGTLKDSPLLQTKIGSGLIHQKQPYARRQYYENKGNGLRGKLWFERMKADHIQDILDGANNESRKNGGE